MYKFPKRIARTLLTSIILSYTPHLFAQATWTGTNTLDLNSYLNWNPTTVPVGNVATFTSTPPTLRQNPSLGSVLTVQEFNIQSGTYTFTLLGPTPTVIPTLPALPSPTAVLSFSGGLGVSNTSGNLQTFNLQNYSAINFNGNSSADATASGNVKYNLNSNGAVNFNDTSTASNANFVFGNILSSLNFNQNIDNTFSGSLTGTGGSAALNINLGTPTTVLTFTNTENTFTGTTNITSGILQAGGVNTLPLNSDFVLATGGTLNLNNYNNTIGSLAGTGGSVQIGTATLTLVNSNNTQYAGSISGTGILDFVGTGSLTYTGNATGFTGTTNISGGLFSLTGSLGSQVNVISGGSLGGTGTVLNNVFVNSGAIIVPGNNSLSSPSIGTLNITGDYNQEIGSTYVLMISGSQGSSKINVNGTATLSGGNVDLLPVGGYDISQTYHILSGSTVTGTFAGITDPLNTTALLTPQLIYSANAVNLEFQTAIVNAASTPNTFAVADRLDGITNPTASQLNILNSIVNLPEAEAFIVLNKLSGVEYTADPLIIEQSNRHFIRKMYTPLRPIVTAFPSDECEPCEDECDTWDCLKTWFAMDGSYYSGSGNRNFTGFHASGLVFTGGVQKTFLEDFTVGLAGSYEYNWIHLHRFVTKHNMNTMLVGAYGLYRPDRFYFLGDLAFGYSAGRMTRHLEFGTVNTKAHSNPDLSQFTFYSEAGVDLPLCSFLIQPFVGVEVADFHRNKIVEKGAADLNLTIFKIDRAITTSRLGTHITSDELFPGYSTSMDFAWNYRFNRHSFNQLTQFATFGTPFTIEGRENSRNSFDIAFAGAAVFWDRWTVTGEVVGEIWSHGGSIYALAGIEYAW
jgi:autotransporter-associated beta strand protein